MVVWDTYINSPWLGGCVHSGAVPTLGLCPLGGCAHLQDLVLCPFGGCAHSGAVKICRTWCCASVLLVQMRVHSLLRLFPSLASLQVCKTVFQISKAGESLLVVSRVCSRSGHFQGAAIDIRAAHSPCGEAVGVLQTGRGF